MDGERIESERGGLRAGALAAVGRIDPWVAAAAALSAVLTVTIALHYRAAAAATETFVGQGFPLDDAWIHAQFALNASRGHLLEYNVGTPSSGSTSPLWSLVEGLGMVFLGDPVTTGHALGVAATFLMGLLTILLGRGMGLRGLALVALPVAQAMSWHVAWASVSGMEVTFVGALVVACFLVYLRERDRDGLAVGSGVLAGLLFWGRPEGLAAIGVIAVDQVYLAVIERRAGRPWRSILRRSGSLLAAWAAVALPLMAWNAAVGPGPFPQTLYAKRSVQTLGRSVHMFFQFFVDLGGPTPAGQVFLAAAAYGLARRLLDWKERFAQATPALFLLAWFGGIALLRGSGDYYSRYLMPCLPLLFLFSVDALQAATRALAPWARAPAVVAALAGLGLQTWPGVEAMAGTYGLNVASVSGHVVAMGRWAARHVPRDAVLAMSDVGGISYFTENRVVDMRGLISPYYGWDRLAELDRQRREGVDYAMLFPELDERVILGGGYVPVHAITLDANNISATDNLVAYRTPWSGGRRLERVGRGFDFDLEAPDYRGWWAEGVLARPPVEGALEGQRAVIDLGGGSGLASSWGAAGDGDVGRAVSPPFVIEGDVITLRVGGGDDPERLGVRLWVDGRIERTAVGERSEVLVEREWDVRDLRGRTARLELRDASDGVWGHVLVDSIFQWRVLEGRPPELRDWPLEGPAEPVASRRAAEADPPPPLRDEP